MTKFSDLKLDPKVLKAIADAGYETPTPIQAGAIPPALEGRDVLGIAQTGTGKTASFTLPMITLLGRGRARARMPRSLVLCPTRELAAQVAENFDTYASHTKLTKALLIGGVSFAEQDKLIDRGVDVLIATPGRLLDHFERGKLLLTGVQIMVVDEADRMLDMGFIPDIERIFQLTPFTRQTLFFSATMAPEIERITNTFLHAPERIEVARQATTSETITQRLVELAPTRKDQTVKQKRELLRALIDAEAENLTNAIIFCNRKTDVDILAKSLKKHGYDASPIHGDLDQSHRTRTLESFRDGKLKLLIASDVAARGLDIPAVSHVFNFDLPSHAEDYVHRIGRTGRAGRTGTAISVATPSDEKLLAAIENLVKQTLPRVPAPEGFELSQASQDAPRPREDRKDGRNPRRRGRRGDERPEERREERREPKPAPAPVAEQRSPEHREAPKQQPEQARDDQRGRDRGRDRRGRGHDDGRGHVVVGMGDHVPQFMLVALRPLESLTDEQEPAAPAPAKAAPRAEAQPVAETPVEAPAEAAAIEVTATEVKKPARTRRKKPEPEVAEADAAVAPKKATRSRKKPAEPTEAVAETAPAEKPKRTRRKKPETGTEETEAAPKPRRRRKADVAETDATPAPAEDTANADA